MARAGSQFTGRKRRASESTATGAQVTNVVYERLRKTCPYGYWFKDVHCQFHRGVLTLTGRLPTFYMKQLLPSWLADIAGVREIDNQVDVVNSAGLSSVRPR